MRPGASLVPEGHDPVFDRIEDDRNDVTMVVWPRCVLAGRRCGGRGMRPRRADGRDRGRSGRRRARADGVDRLEEDPRAERDLALGRVERR